MAEHFNFAVLIDKAFEVERRKDVVWALRDAFLPFFNELSEICLIDSVAHTTRSEKWGGFGFHDLLVADLGVSQLLFIYSSNRAGFRNSIHLEQGQSGTVFVVSLVIGEEECNLEKCRLQLELYAAGLSCSTLLGAGWELELEATATIEENIDDLTADSSLCSWLGIPKRLVHSVPRTFEKTKELGRLVFFNRPLRLPSGW